jgi:outer membrane immunogenic protein
MKKTLAASTLAIITAGSAANAADLPVKAPVYKAPPAAIYNWTGFYAGLNAGVGVGQTKAKTIDDGAQGSVDRTDAGFAGGAQVGVNWQFAPQLVAGVEGDIGHLGIKRSFRDWVDDDIFGVMANGYGTIRGRLGLTNGPSLFYATGGAAFVHVENSYFDVGQSVLSKSKTAGGWTAGGGIETMLGGNWSAKSEYLYIDAGSQDVFNPAAGSSASPATARFDNRFHVYRYGVNYKFGGPALASSALPARNWTGFHIGVNAGAALSQNHADTGAFPEGAVDIADSGFTGGVQAGHDWQFAPNWVAGIEGDIGFLGINRSFANWNNADNFFGVKADWYGAVRGRLGYSTGPALLYVTGGAAFVSVRNNFDNIAPTPDVFASKSETAGGWTVGGGIETALAQNWTAKTEYLYIDAGSQDVFNPDGFLGPVTAHFDNRFHVFRFGVNYNFGG